MTEKSVVTNYVSVSLNYNNRETKLGGKAYKDNPTQNDWEVNIDSQCEHKSVLSLLLQ